MAMLGIRKTGRMTGRVKSNASTQENLEVQWDRGEKGTVDLHWQQLASQLRVDRRLPYRMLPSF